MSTVSIRIVCRFSRNARVLAGALRKKSFFRRPKPFGLSTENELANALNLMRLLTLLQR